MRGIRTLSRTRPKLTACANNGRFLAAVFGTYAFCATYALANGDLGSSGSGGITAILVRRARSLMVAVLIGLPT